MGEINDNLFLLSDPMEDRFIRMKLIDPRAKNKGFHDWILKVFRGEASMDSPLRLQQNMGHEPGEIIWSTHPPILLVNQEVINLMQEYNFTGWKSFSVEALDKYGNQIPGYSGLSITGRAGERDLSRGQVITKDPITANGKSYQVLRGFNLKDDYWDRNDFCLSGYAGHVITTNRVVEEFSNAGFINVAFTPLSESEIKISTLEIMGRWPPPGRE